MAQEPENRMLFDLRGRRKRVIQVIYVLLAVIMAASLIVIGMPGGMNPFSGGTTSLNRDAAEANIERAENLERRLQTQPNNANVAVELVRARFSAARSLYATDDDTQQTSITDEAIAQYDLAADAWDRYLRVTRNQPEPDVAQLMAGVFFELSQGSTVAQFQSNIADAAAAQQFVTDEAVREQRQGGSSAANQLTQLATYQYYAQEFDAADQTRDQALAAANSDADRQEIRRTLNATEEDARRIGRLINRAIRQAQQDGGQSLQNPLGSLGSDSSLDGTTEP